jgi:transcriptional regulator with XRE-family HTH domain
VAGNLLGEYLRARRERVAPGDVGLDVRASRRVNGLRREEVALLAGISPDYYVRLEQGRDRRPSAEILASLSRVLCLDEAATAHLMALGAARPAATIAPGGHAGVPATIGQLLRAMALPAFVEDEHFDVLESNFAARALSAAIAPGRNRVLTTFLDPAERGLFLDFDIVAAELVAGFRASLSGAADDRRTAELVAELSAGSERFRELWARHDVEDLVGRPTVRLAHPVVGDLTLTRDNVAVDGRHGLRLVIYHAEPGSESFDKLGRLHGQKPG